MTTFRAFLIASTILIYGMTLIAAASHGVNWPAVALADLAALDWRSQFDTDFILYLLLFASWVVWREGATVKAYVFGVVSVVLGGMFGFPYLLLATYRCDGDLRRVLLGTRA